LASLDISQYNGVTDPTKKCQKERKHDLLNDMHNKRTLKACKNKEGQQIRLIQITKNTFTDEQV